MEYGRKKQIGVSILVMQVETKDGEVLELTTQVEVHMRQFGATYLEIASILWKRVQFVMYS